MRQLTKNLLMLLVITVATAPIARADGVLTVAPSSVDDTRTAYAKINTHMNVLPAVPSYLGELSTGTLYPNNLNVTKQNAMARSFHFARDNIVDMMVALPGFYGNGGTNGEASTGVNTTWTGSVEYPAGTCRPFAFGGATVGTALDGSFVWSDLMTALVIPKGSPYWIRLYESRTANLLLRSGAVNVDNGAALAYGTTGAPVADQTQTCDAITPSGTANAGNPTTPGTGFMLAPLAIVGHTTVPSFALIGDSRFAGSQDAYMGVTADIGTIPRAVGQFAGYANLSESGETVADFLAHGTNRLALAPYATHIVFELQINDLIGGASAATAEGNITAALALLPTGKKVYVTTSEPVVTLTSQAISTLVSSGNGVMTATVTSTAPLFNGETITIAGTTPSTMSGPCGSVIVLGTTTFSCVNPTAPLSTTATGTVTFTDAAQSTAGQTTVSYCAANNAVNDWKRAGLPGVNGVLDLSDIVSSGRNSCKWGIRAGGGALQGAETADLTHEMPNMYQAVGNSTKLRADSFLN